MRYQITGIRALHTISLSIVKLWQPEHEHSSSATDCGTLSLGGHFSTNTEKTLFGAEPPGGLLKNLKKLLTRAFTNSDLAEFPFDVGRTARSNWVNAIKDMANGEKK